MNPQQLILARKPRYSNEALGADTVPSSSSGPPGSAPRSGPRLAGGRELGLARAPGAIGRQGAPLDMRQVLDFPAPSEAQLRALLDLTPAEARLAQLLASGDTLEEVAQKLGIKLTTARSQLAVIFSKTDIRRQTKLVAILSRIAHLE